MRIIKIFVDFLKVFIEIKPKKIKNYLNRTNAFIKSKNQIIEQKLIVKKISKYSKKIILDYGCNNCFFSKQLGKRFIYYGVDKNKELLNKKVKIYSKNFFFLKNNKIPFKKFFFDCIILSHVIAHIYEPHKLLAKLEKILKKDGIIIIVSPNKYFKFFYFFSNLFNSYWPDETISKHYSDSELIKKVKDKWKVLENFSYSLNSRNISSKMVDSRFMIILKK